jgi:hypothetical protein
MSDAPVTIVAHASQVGRARLSASKPTTPRPGTLPLSPRTTSRHRLAHIRRRSWWTRPRLSARRLLPVLAPARADEVVRPRPALGRLVVGVQKFAGVDGEAAATDAGRKPIAQRLQRGDPPVEVLPPAARESFPVAAVGRPLARECRQRGPDRLERDAGRASRLDERDAAEGSSLVAALVSRGSARTDQSFRLVEAECRRRDAAARRDFADCELPGHET